MSRLLPYLLVALGSALGGVCRFAVSRVLGPAEAGRFPLSTFLVNVGGSFVLGVLAAFVLSRSAAETRLLSLAVGVGFCGGLTTFSTFTAESHDLADAGALGMSAAYVVASVVGGLLALRLGIVFGRSWF